VPAKKPKKHGSPRQRAPRRAPNFDQVLDETTRLLDTVGETGLRIEELIAATGVSKSSLYQQFSDRDGLIAAARARQFEAIVNESIDGIKQLVSSATTRQGLRDALHAATVFTQNISRNADRIQRAAIVAGTVGRPAFAKQLTAAQTRLTDALTSLISEARRDGQISPTHPDRTIAMFIQAYTFGRVLSSFDSKRGAKDNEEWVALIDDVIDRLLFA
jgi:AcrR family transcriptional regulator